MRLTLVGPIVLAALTPALAHAAPPKAGAESARPAPIVELEMLTWPELKAALAAGKTTALIYTGGTEQRGPQNVLGGHNLMARATVRAIAERLGDAIALPVLPFTPNRADPELPGTLGINYTTLTAVLTDVAEQAIANGFRNVVLMGDHGAGQGPDQPTIYADVARALDAKYASQGARVVFCDQVYRAANAEFNRQITSEGCPPGIHAALSDTSEMFYLDRDGLWVRRDLLPAAVGDPVGADGKRMIGPDSPRNGITGDARRASAALGYRQFELKVEYAVRQIRQMVPRPN